MVARDDNHSCFGSGIHAEIAGVSAGCFACRESAVVPPRGVPSIAWPRTAPPRHPRHDNPASPFEALRFKAMLPPGFVFWCAEHETLMTAWHFTDAHDSLADTIRRRYEHAVAEIVDANWELTTRWILGEFERNRRSS